MKEKKEWLKSLVVDFLETDVNRAGGSFGDMKIWDVPRVGFANGADEIFKKYKAKDTCGEEHWTPADIFAKFYPESDFKEDELTIVSWILPQMPETKASLRAETHNPSELWSRSRILGEPINDLVREHMVKTLHEAGYEAAAPILHPEWTRLENPEQIITSKWSERHIAHAAGHGTFGFCDALITPVGKAHRTGSVIVRLKVEPDKRPYKGIYDYCLYYKDGSCLVCVERCTPGALTKEEGHLKMKCREFLRGYSTDYNREHFSLDGYGCGFCQTKVPCEHGIPEGIE